MTEKRAYFNYIMVFLSVLDTINTTAYIGIDVL